MDNERDDLLRTIGYSQDAINLINDEVNVGEIKDPTVTMKYQSPVCGDIMVIHLKIEENKITNASYNYIGCAGLQACASALTTMVKGKDLEDARKIDVEDIVKFLGSIPDKKYECAETARDTLRKAIDTYQKKS